LQTERLNWRAESGGIAAPGDFGAPDTLDRLFLPQAFNKAKTDFQPVAEEFSKKNIHQKLEISRIDLQHLNDGVVLKSCRGRTTYAGITHLASRVTGPFLGHFSSEAAIEGN